MLFTSIYAFVFVWCYTLIKKAAWLHDIPIYFLGNSLSFPFCEVVISQNYIIVLQLFVSFFVITTYYYYHMYKPL